VRRLTAIVVVLASGCTPAQDARPVERVDVALTEWTFGSSRSTFTAGTPYRFTLSNSGAVAHEWAVVPRGATDESRLLVEVEEDRLPSGGRAELVFTFPAAGEYDFACFLPGHLESGMRIPITVLPPERA